MALGRFDRSMNEIVDELHRQAIVGKFFPRKSVKIFVIEFNDS
jgi:hypothetical protein